ncbi:hypothetical protein ACFLS4_00865 [Bacteroidota bacterium]
MKKISLLAILFVFLANMVNAQLEVNDTLLLAYKNNTFWGSSSELEQDIYADFGKYGSTNLSDNDAATCWAEGSSSSGEGEFIVMTIPEKIVNLRIRNGYQKNETIYYANNRPKIIEFTLYASYEPAGYITESHNGFFISKPITSTQTVLEDKIGFQEVNIGIDWSEIFSQISHDRTFDKDRFILKIKILEIYKGEKWNDACISDINIVPNPFYDITMDEHGLLRVFPNKTDTLFYKTENIYQVVDVSFDLHWVIFILMPSDIENSRVETVYKLYNTKKEQFIEIKDIFEMYGFVKKSGKLYLEGSDKDFNDFNICLDNL